MENSDEKNFLLDKSYTCPVCGAEFKSKAVKTGAAKLIDTAMDLRPKYQKIDVTKYDVILCPECGYAALSRYFEEISSAQIMYIQEKVSANFKKRTAVYDYYNYDVAMERFKLALLSTMVKNGAPSEIGYVCLKISWLLQGRKEALDKDLPNAAALEEKYDQESKSYSKKALENLMKARMEENYPICGMDETTLDYLLAALAAMDQQYDVAMRMLGTVSADRNASDRLKNKAYDLKEFINKEKDKES